MSGVNAHALFSCSGADDAPAAAPPLPFRTARHWALPRPHQLLGRARGGAGGKLAFSCQLCRGELGYMWHHQVRLLAGPARARQQGKLRSNVLGSVKKLTIGQQTACLGCLLQGFAMMRHCI